jgi:hypothetical protein
VSDYGIQDGRAFNLGVFPGQPERERELCLELLGGLYSILRTAAIHDINNKAMEKPTDALHAALLQFFRGELQTLTCVSIDGQFYVNDTRIPVVSQQYYLVEHFEKVCQRRGIGGISFLGAPSVRQLKLAASLIQHTRIGADGVGHERITEALDKEDVNLIQVTPAMRLRLEGEERLKGEALPAEVDATLAYAKAVAILEQLASRDRETVSQGSSHIRRIVQELIDCLDETQDYMIGLTQWMRGSDDLVRVIINAAIVAIALGRAVGLSRAQLRDLGQAALSIAIRYESDDPDPFGEPIQALRELEVGAHWNASMMRRVLTLAERRLDFRDGERESAQYPLARIYRVARDFVVCTQGGARTADGRRLPPTAMHALAIMRAAPEGTYDPTILAQLVTIVGIYPLGTLLQLKGGEEAFVVGRTGAARPIIRLRDPSGGYSNPMVLENHDDEVVAIREDVASPQRAQAVLGARVQRMIGELNENFANRSILASVALRRLVSKKDGDSFGI